MSIKVDEDLELLRMLKEINPALKRLFKLQLKKRGPRARLNHEAIAKRF